MRIDHAPVQSLPPPNNPPHRTTGGEVQGVGNHVMSPKASNYRLLQAETDASPATNRDLCPMLIGSKVDGFERKGQAWFVATELQSDLVVEVGEMSFHLHKFPLLSRSGKLNRLVFDSRDTENSHIKLDDMPGGPETFELAAKFCYGVAVELTSANVAALRCAAEYLEMTEDLDEGNLVSKTEAFLSFVVLASWKDSITVLRGCEKLLPWADQLQIVRRCCESIAWKACTDPRGIRWSFTQRQEMKKPIHASPLWNGPKNQLQVGSAVSDQVPSDWWLEDICVVCVHFFTKIIQAIKAKGMRHDLIGSAIVHYAIKWLPGLTRELVKDSKDPVSVDGSLQAVGGHCPQPSAKSVTDRENGRANDLASVQIRNRELIEALAMLIPPQKDAAPCTFLLRLLRLAKMVGVNPVVITDLEKRAGLQLDQGTLSDLLIPSFDHTCETLFDVDLVQRMLDYFLLQEFISPPGTLSPVESEREKFGLNSTVDKGLVATHSTYPAKMRVAKLIDNYLVEVGRDQNLTLNKFLTLAEALPENTRVTDDGLYKAIDTYLKAHPELTENERKKLCRTLDCQRLSLDACMHAAQNERLPLRVVVQVLFGEQIKLRNAVTGTSSLSKDQSDPYPAEDDRMSIGGSSHESVLHDHDHDQEHDQEHSEEEIKVLRSDVERMKGKFIALQHDYTAIQLQLEKLTKNPKPQSSASGWKKIFPHPHLPHPHFHVPHFLSHPMDLFHHKDHNHHGKESGTRHSGQAPEKGQVHPDIQQPYHSKKYDSRLGVHSSKDHDESQLKIHPPQHSKEHLKDGHRKSQGSSKDFSQDVQQQRQVATGDSSYNSLHSKLSDLSPQSKDNDHYHPSKDRSHPLNDPSIHAAGHHVHPQPADPRFSKDGDSYHSGSHADSGEDSSRSLEGPATPTHTVEQHKKHARPFANAIRKWRNSIS
ncbi:unnamed protein product [Calypogeia fissa]